MARAHVCGACVCVRVFHTDARYVTDASIQANIPASVQTGLYAEPLTTPDETTTTAGYGAPLTSAGHNSHTYSEPLQFANRVDYERPVDDDEGDYSQLADNSQV